MEPSKRGAKALLTFVVIGGGPTGVELAGAIAELASSTLASGLPGSEAEEARIVLLEQQPASLPSLSRQVVGQRTASAGTPRHGRVTGSTVEAMEDDRVQ